MTLADPITLVLRPRIHLAWCGDDVVILDLQSDQYGLLVDARAVLAPGPDDGTILVDPLVQSDVEGLGLAGTASAPSFRNPLPGCTGDIGGSSGTALLVPFTLAALHTVGAVMTFHGRPLGRLVENAAGLRHPRRPSSLKRLARATAAFQAVHPWIPFEGDCLQRGYRLHHHLRRLGFDARWVFGVRTWPFLAHCWVQVGDLVVGDTTERVSGFVPILAV